jgi:hypothetical protein
VTSVASVTGATVGGRGGVNAVGAGSAAAAAGVKSPVTGLTLNVFGATGVVGLNGFAVISSASGEAGVVFVAKREGGRVFSDGVFNGVCVFAGPGTGNASAGFDGGKMVGVNVRPVVVEGVPGLDCGFGVAGVAGVAGMAGMAGAAVDADFGVAGVAGMAGVAAEVGLGVAVGLPVAAVPVDAPVPGAVADEFDELSGDAESSCDGSAEATVCPVASPSHTTTAATEERKMKLGKCIANAPAVQRRRVLQPR